MRKNLVPGYLGNTNYWFGLAGFGRTRRIFTPKQIAESAKREKKMREQQEKRRQKSREVVAKKAARRAKQQAALRAKQQTAKIPPKPTAPPLITPKAPVADEMALMEELRAMESGGASPEMDTGGGESIAPSGEAAPAPTVEEMLEDRSAKAEVIAEEFAAKQIGRKRVYPRVEAESESEWPEEPILPQRPGFIGRIIDVIFGPPAPIF